MAPAIFELEAQSAVARNGEVCLPEFARGVTRPTLGTYVQANKPLKSIGFCFP
jgi:hypothetical protein